MVGAFDGVQFVGAPTGTPMEEHADDFAKAFSSSAYALGDIFYCRESVLLSKYRGRGQGAGGRGPGIAFSMRTRPMRDRLVAVTQRSVQ
jgi:hypothetical protein